MLWEHLCALLETELGVGDSQAAARTKMWMLRQGKDESVAAYVARARTTIGAVVEALEVDRMHAFIEGLHTPVKAEVRRVLPTSLAFAMSLALSAAHTLGDSTRPTTALHAIDASPVADAPSVNATSFERSNKYSGKRKRNDQDQGRKKGKSRECHRCHKLGHMAAWCPEPAPIMKKQTMQLHHLAATPSVTQEEVNKLSVFDYVDCVSKCESSKSTKLREEVDAPIADVTCNDEIWTGNEQLSERSAHTVITPVSLNQHNESDLFLLSLDTELV